jgi:hypothetical protein
LRTGESEIGVAIRHEALKCPVLLPVVEEVGIRKLVWNSASVRGADCHQPIRLDKRQGTEYDGIQNRENSSARANSKSQRQSRPGGESFGPRQLAAGVSKVSDRGSERRQSAHFSKAILQPEICSQLSISRASCLRPDLRMC